MEQTLNLHIAAPRGFLASLRRKILTFQTYRQRLRDTQKISQLPDHLLRDIGYEGSIVRRSGPAPYGY